MQTIEPEKPFDKKPEIEPIQPEVPVIPGWNYYGLTEEGDGIIYKSGGDGDSQMTTDLYGNRIDQG